MTGAIYKQHPSDQWFTPSWLRALAVQILGHVSLDVATCSCNPLGAQVICTEGAFSADAWAWVLTGEPMCARNAHGTYGVWCNPPYGRATGKWIDALSQLSRARADVEALALIPARPGARWYRRACASAQLLCEINGRVAFDLHDPETHALTLRDPARFANALLWYGPADRQAAARRALARVGRVQKLEPAKRRQRPKRTDARQLNLGRIAPLRMVKP